MSAWEWAAVALTAALFPCAWVCLRGPATHRLVGLEMTATVMSSLLIVLAEAQKQVSFYDLGLALALLSLGGGLVFARFLERWL